MSELENAGKPYSLPPPSYEEAVFGNGGEETQNATPLISETTPPSPPPQTPGYPQPQGQPQPSAPQHTESHCNTQQQSQQPNPLPYAYNRDLNDICPTGAEMLRDLNEFLVYPRNRWAGMYEIRDGNKDNILNCKLGSGDCCDDCCSCTATLNMCSLDNRMLYTADCMTDQVNCFGMNEQHIDVWTSGRVRVGTVYIKSLIRATIVNQSGDLLFNIIKPDSWFSNDPCEIFDVRGTKVGEIDSRRGVKNRMILSEDLPIKDKILLLYYAIHRQCLEDNRRKNSNFDNM